MNALHQSRIAAPRIVLTANSMRNLAQFRRPLFAGFVARGLDTVALAPFDVAETDGPATRQISISIDRGGLNPLRDLKTIISYVAELRRLKPNVILGFTPKANIYAGLAARMADIPFIPTVSGLGTGFLKGGAVRRVMQALYRHAFARAPIIIFQNDDDRAEFVRLGLVDPARSRVMPGSGIDLAHFRPAPFPPPGPLRLLFIGRLIRDKGIYELVGAVKQLRDQGIVIQLSVLGERDTGNPSAVPADVLEQWGKDGLVDWLGHRDDVRPFIAACDAVVLPSYREGMPRALLEAAAMGRPMVATDVPGCRDIVRDGETGFLCSPRDPEALANAIKRLVNQDVADRDRMAAVARTLVERQFDQALVVEQYLDALASIGIVWGGKES